jgi:hypothetical protein
VEVIFMDGNPPKPDLEFNVRVQLETMTQPGRYTLTGLAPGDKRVMYVFRTPQDLVKYLEWVAVGCPRLH